MLAQPSTSGPFAFASGPEAQTPRTLTELDERLAVGTPGIVLVRAPATVGEALLAHSARRAKSGGREAIVARGRAGAPLWHEVAAKLSIAKLACEPPSAAAQIATNAFLRRAVVVAPLPASGSWDRAVATELSLLPNAPLVVLIGDGEDEATEVRGERFDVAPTLHEDAKARWWRALAEEANAIVGSEDLAAYEAWWSKTKREPVAASATSATCELPEEGRALFTGLALAAAPWAEAAVERLGGTRTALVSLVRAGAVATSSGWVSVAPAWSVQAEAALRGASTEERCRIAAALTSDPDPQPWAFARASELLAHTTADSTAIEAADSAHTKALASAADPTARREIVTRWMAAVDSLPPQPRRELLMRAAERALAASEPDEAMRCAQAAAVASSEDARTLLLMGRVAGASGDLVGGRVALKRARQLAVAKGDAEVQALATAEEAELACRAGDVATARELALDAIDRTTDAVTRITARNTLGKLLLFEWKWDEADRHFAEDGLLAAAAHDVVAELRARLNRGIAMLSKGQIDEARTIFDTVLAEGERRNEPRAKAYALVNLGVIAMRRHEYGAALTHWERTIKLLHAMHDRGTVAYALANLAELRHFLGLRDYAEHAISFGRRTLGSGMTPSRAAQFGVVAARVALSRGRSQEARREIEGAIASAEHAKDQEMLGQAYRMAARIALDDGDLARLGTALEKARGFSTKDDGVADVALLDALFARASGKDAMGPALAALALARTAAKEELLRETHVLLAELCRGCDDRAGAREHLDQAALVRDKIAEGLASDVREAFLARGEIALLARLQAQLAEPISAPSIVEEDAVSSSRPVRGGAAREMVGDDPAIRGLLAAIRKVARSNSTVLVRGESGTGKELVAEALHRGSERAAGPLVTVNCAALVETLLLSELFGHEKGAFTGASVRRRGRFELAEGGTLFLDEIGDISARTQVALLRVLQERTFERVGGTAPIQADVRIVCATHRDLRAMVERGEFREDLYYRLRGITLEVPALRSRMGDLPRIAEHLLGRIAAERSEGTKTLSPDALELLGRHRWPGNIRELENALRAASLFAESNVITARDLTDNLDDLRAVALATPRSSSPPSLPSSQSSPADDPSSDDLDGSDSDGPLPQIEANATSIAYAQVRQGTVSLSDIKRQIERDCIARALAETKGNITRAASLLGMKRPRLSQLVKQYGLAAVSSEA